jgi:multiple sugar transport system permease protein
MGYASAMSVVLGIVMLAYTIVQMQVMRANDNDLS